MRRKKSTVEVKETKEPTDISKQIFTGLFELLSTGVLCLLIAIFVLPLSFAVLYISAWIMDVSFPDIGDFILRLYVVTWILTMGVFMYKNKEKYTLYGKLLKS